MSPRDISNAPRPAATDFMVRIGASVSLVPVLESLGADPSALLTEAGADMSLFESPDNWVSYKARNHWVAHCVERTGCRHIGLLVGQQHSAAIVKVGSQQDVVDLGLWIDHGHGASVVRVPEGLPLFVGQ